MGRCVMNVLERHEKMELLCGLDSPEGQQAGSDKCDKRGMGGAGGDNFQHSLQFSTSFDSCRHLHGLRVFSVNSFF